jgi:hypothetical protein
MTEDPAGAAARRHGRLAGNTGYWERHSLAEEP